MIQINLLPPEERSIEIPLKRAIRVSIFFVCLLLVSLYGYGLYTELTLQQDLQRARNQYELLRPTQQKMLAADQKQQAIINKNAILTALTKERKSWHAVFAHLGTVVPEQVWLTEVSAGNENLLLIKGKAANYPEVAAFLKKLAKDSLFTDMVLIKAEQEMMLDTLRFEVSVKIKGL
ncbi:MAG TPA: hypothetical protein DCP36_18825 [Sporomusaceae bacterium]|jgi:Tfp pilus assembly protein PilN|nr:hypothetical protein [Sporomusaceae bacterium]